MCIQQKAYFSTSIVGFVFSTVSPLWGHQFHFVIDIIRAQLLLTCPGILAYVFHICNYSRQHSHRRGYRVQSRLFVCLSAL